MINSIIYLIKITDDMAHATRLYATLVETRLNTKLLETKDLSYCIKEVNFYFEYLFLIKYC